ncbi:hypothetical protein [Picrophilus oshimae]|uniref:Uncharacterized protein n=1 Tax=Picrophilus torridus (strain ATCC 700027 / DSM 9790 / JCM 10055 / NBRC 100828 / KAW 2/3) TaxID=1122961 RepID=Q6KZB0_PICTO|nr:hypothetical protein [Picrophilus oshimae]AAT43942.1 hypothetical protein PTO1357 [Picrophilus oshimae DSM 9789]SMD30984.1 hypothetical protein SAMN02745355_0902 [Picrophilus oshimae DSM 9789]
MAQRSKSSLSKYIKMISSKSILDFLINGIYIDIDIDKIIRSEIDLESQRLRSKFNYSIIECAIKAINSAYYAALNGMTSAAFENNRFFLERVSLTKIISMMNIERNPYLMALEDKKWHEIINDKLIIYGAAQFTGRLKHYYGKSYDLYNACVYLTGVPLCSVHSKKFIKYSMTIDEISDLTKKKIDEKCNKCNKKAKRFVIALPKAGAVIALLGIYTNKDTTKLGRFYADYSRVLHPYGFYNYPKEMVFNLWALDTLRLFHVLNNIIR